MHWWYVSDTQRHTNSNKNQRNKQTTLTQHLLILTWTNHTALLLCKHSRRSLIQLVICSFMEYYLNYPVHQVYGELVYGVVFWQLDCLEDQGSNPPTAIMKLGDNFVHPTLPVSCSPHIACVFCSPHITCVFCLPHITCVFCSPHIVCVFCSPHITCVFCLPHITCVFCSPHIVCVFCLCLLLPHITCVFCSPHIACVFCSPHIACVFCSPTLPVSFVTPHCLSFGHPTLPVSFKIEQKAERSCLVSTMILHKE